MHCRRPSARAALSCGLAVVLFASVAPARAAMLEDVAFRDAVDASGTRLELHGLALLRYRVVFRAYVGGLYLADGADARRVLGDVPKRLELSYFWALGGRDFGEAAEQILADNLSDAELLPLRARIARLHALYRDVEPGDRYALTYLPGVGTELALNDVPLGTIEGADFAAAYFAIWLGREPIDEGFRDRLLGGD